MTRAKTLDGVLTGKDVLAVIEREVSLRIKNISASGCLLESTSPLTPSTTGTLRVTVGDNVYEDVVSVVWCRESKGSSGLFQIGARFMWVPPLGRASLRRVVASMQALTHPLPTEEPLRNTRGRSRPEG